MQKDTPMAPFGKPVLAIYAVLMALGGIMGYVKAQSKISLAAGLGSAVVLAIAYGMAQERPKAACITGAVVALIIAFQMTKTYFVKHTFMPSGLFSIISILALIALVAAALTARE